MAFRRGINFNSLEIAFSWTFFKREEKKIFWLTDSALSENQKLAKGVLIGMPEMDDFLMRSLNAAERKYRDLFWKIDFVFRGARARSRPFGFAAKFENLKY